MLSENLLRGFTPIHEERYDVQQQQSSALSFDDDPRERGQSQLLQQRSDTEFDSNTPQVSSHAISGALSNAYYSLYFTIHTIHHCFE